MNINRYTFKIIPLLAILILFFASCGSDFSDTVVTDTDSEAILDSLGISGDDADNETSELSQDFFNNSESDKIKPHEYADEDNAGSVAKEKDDIGAEYEPETKTEPETNIEPETKDETEEIKPVVSVMTEDKIVGEQSASSEDASYILNIKSQKFHYPSCRGVSTMKEENKEYFHGTRQEAISLGYSSCGICKP